MESDRARILAKKQNKKKSGGISPKPMSEVRYQHYLLTLVEGQVSAREHDVYFDVSPGQRPQVIKAELERVARKEGIDVLITQAKGRPKLLLQYALPLEAPEPVVRVRKKDGEVVKEDTDIETPPPSSPESGDHRG